MSVLFVYDDAFITFRYARNLASGIGLVYNAGERVLGTTTPAFAILLAPLYLLHLPMPQTVQWINIFLDVAILLFTVQILLRKESLLTKILFATFFAVSPILARVTTGGMEVNLFLLLTLTSIWFFENEREYLAVGIAAVSYFVRPEAALLVFLYLGMTTLARSYGKTARLAALAGMLVAIPLIAIQLYYGDFLSQSVRAKMEMEFVGHSSLQDVLHSLFAIDPLLMLLIPFALYGAVIAWRKGGAFRILVYWICGYSLFYCISRPHIVSTWYGESCYYGMILFGAMGIDSLIKLLPFRRLQHVGWSVAIVSSFAAVSFWVLIYLQEGPSPIERDIQVKLADWCKENAVEHSTILAIDIGVVGYYSNAHIFDLYGLVSPDLLPVHDHAPAIAMKKPDYIYAGGVSSIVNEQAGKDYIEIASFNPTYKPGGGMLMKHWFAEYHLFRRKGNLSPAGDTSNRIPYQQ